MGEPIGPYSIEDWQIEVNPDVPKDTMFFINSSNMGTMITNKTLEGFERVANIVIELEQYCDKYTVPLSVKELRKILSEGQ